MFKVDLSRFLKIENRILFTFWVAQKNKGLQVNEILIFFTFLVNGHLKFAYALSTSKVKILIYQYFNVNVFLTQFHQSISKILLTYL
jgi:hypothetical protein